MTRATEEETLRTLAHSVASGAKLLAVLVALVGLWTVEAWGQAGPSPDGETWAAGEAGGATPDSASGGAVSIRLKDGSVLRGRVLRETEDELVVQTLSGVEMTVPRSAIAAIHRLDRETLGEVRSDPNYSRLMFAPTGRPLRKGGGYVFDYWAFFPGAAYGVSDHFTVMAGVSVLPGLGLGDQIKYVAPKFGMDAGDWALSGGALVISVVDELFAGIAFGVGTLGGPDKSATAGLGLGFVKVEDEDLRFGENPVLMLGGNVRLSNSVALVSENWFIMGQHMTIGQQPFCVAARFFGDRVAVDAGFILAGEILKEGFPIPWLSFVYNFGK